MQGQPSPRSAIGGPGAGHGTLPRIHGWLYRVESGTIDVLVDGQGAVKPAAKTPAKGRR
ncbi:MAG: hypothetical protein ACKO9B_10020 [Planctomycetota bacterium]